MKVDTIAQTNTLGTILYWEAEGEDFEIWATLLSLRLIWVT